MCCKTTTSQRICSQGAALRAGTLGFASCLALAACVGEGQAVPPDAIQVAPELYMLPMGTDENGCPLFQPWSPTLAVIQALHWRTPEGDFTLDRDAADCPP